MELGRVALVLCQLVLRVLPVQFQHVTVTADLGQDGCCRDGRTVGIALDDGFFRLGKAGEVYPGIGKDDIALENMPLLADGEGAFGSPTSDSTRAMITQETRSCLTVVFSFSARSKLEEALALTVKRFGQYANPSHAESFIIE